MKDVKKMTFCEKRACGSPPLTVEPPSPAALRRTDGAPDGRDGAETQQTETRRKTKKPEVIEAGRAKEVRAHTVVFVSTLFEIGNI